MRTVRIVFPTSRTPDEFVKLFRDYGGRWIDEPGPGYGVLEKDGGAVYASFVPDVKNSIERYSNDEIDSLKNRLNGLEPRSLVSIDIGHAPASDGIAKQIVAGLVSSWSGVPDWSGAE
jgi:hypothetical protein